MKEITIKAIDGIIYRGTLVSTSAEDYGVEDVYADGKQLFGHKRIYFKKSNIVWYSEK